MDFKYLLTDKANYIHIEFIGSLIEKHQAVELMQEVEELLMADKNKFVIDLSKLQFINHGGVGVLLKLMALARKNGGEVAVYHLPEGIKETPEGKKINSVLNLSENEFIAAALLG